MTLQELTDIAESILNGDSVEVAQPHNLGWFDWEPLAGDTPAEMIVVMVNCNNRGWAVRIKPNPTGQPRTASVRSVAPGCCVSDSEKGK